MKGDTMAKLQHVAMSAPDSQAVMRFYCDAFDTEVGGHTNSPLATREYISDGIFSLALLNYETDEWAGINKDEKYINPIGFWVDDLQQQSAKREKGGGEFFHELPPEKVSLSYEVKFRDPNGIIFDISQDGLVAAKT
jgi:methylmalonyl-CoA/ethylmalonyl-CoA epimerase